MKSQLHIPVIEGKAHLGCSEKERKKAQKVEVGIEIRFRKLAPAIKSDNLDETPCYAEMSTIILKSFAKKHYATIENLGMNCFKDVEEYLGEFDWLKGSKFTLTLKKVAPPIEAIKGGSLFTLQKKI